MKRTDKDIIKAERMSYKVAKDEYRWFQTIDGSYDSKTKTIEVVTQCRTHYMEDEI